MKNIYENYYRTVDGTYTPEIRLIVKKWWHTILVVVSLRFYCSSDCEKSEINRNRIFLFLVQVYLAWLQLSNPLTMGYLFFFGLISRAR